MEEIEFHLTRRISPSQSWTNSYNRWKDASENLPTKSLRIVKFYKILPLLCVYIWKYEILGVLVENTFINQLHNPGKIMHDPAFLDPTCNSLFIRTENKLKLQKEEKKKKKKLVVTKTKKIRIIYSTGWIEKIEKDPLRAIILLRRRIGINRKSRSRSEEYSR